MVFGDHDPVVVGNPTSSLDFLSGASQFIGPVAMNQLVVTTDGVMEDSRIEGLPVNMFWGTEPQTEGGYSVEDYKPASKGGAN